MPPEPTVHLVADPTEWAELARLVAGLADRAAGRMVLHPTPGVRTPLDFAADTLTSLGKRFDALRFERAGTRAWDLVDIWFQAEGVRDLFITRAATVEPENLMRLTELAVRHGSAVWQIWARGAPALSRPARWDGLTFSAHWRRRAGGVEASDEDAEFPEVPDDDFLTFRWSCHRLLDAASFERVDRSYRQSMLQSTEWLRARTGRDRRPVVDADAVATQLQGLLVSAPSRAEALTRLRGAQAAYFWDHLLIEFPTSSDAGRGGLVPLAPSLDPTTARRLRRFCIPMSTAAMALVLATDLRGDGLSRLNVGQVAPDGGGVEIGDSGHRFTIPLYARSLVRALIVERTLAGATSDDPLFVDPRDGGRASPDRMRTVLRKVAWAAGMTVGSLVVESSVTRPAQWLDQRQLRLSQLNVEAALGA